VGQRVAKRRQILLPLLRTLNQESFVHASGNQVIDSARIMDSCSSWHTGALPGVASKIDLLVNKMGPSPLTAAAGI